MLINFVSKCTPKSPKTSFSENLWLYIADAGPNSTHAPRQDSRAEAKRAKGQDERSKHKAKAQGSGTRHCACTLAFVTMRLGLVRPPFAFWHSVPQSPGLCDGALCSDLALWPRSRAPRPVCPSFCACAMTWPSCLGHCVVAYCRRVYGSIFVSWPLRPGLAAVSWLCALAFWSHAPWPGIGALRRFQKRILVGRTAAAVGPELGSEI